MFANVFASLGLLRACQLISDKGRQSHAPYFGTKLANEVVLVIASRMVKILVVPIALRTNLTSSAGS
jgi:hypothetical protein